MKTYIVKFWWRTDLKAEAKVDATDELKALARALDEVGLGPWVSDMDFRIEITRA